LVKPLSHSGSDVTVELSEWLRGRRALISIDADFFSDPEEVESHAEFEGWLDRTVANGVAVTVSRDHVDLVAQMPPVDVVINFDYHMDLRLEFLFGAPALHPAQDASVFESILVSGLTQRYVWAHPQRRSVDAARVYASSVLAGRQPLIQRIHCLPGVTVMRQLIQRPLVESVFVCQSPDYSTPDSDSIFATLAAIAASATSGTAM
jgi:hypothetical protein